MDVEPIFISFSIHPFNHLISDHSIALSAIRSFTRDEKSSLEWDRQTFTHSPTHTLIHSLIQSITHWLIHVDRSKVRDFEKWHSGAWLTTTGAYATARPVLRNIPLMRGWELRRAWTRMRLRAKLFFFLSFFVCLHLCMFLFVLCFFLFFRYVVLQNSDRCKYYCANTYIIVGHGNEFLSLFTRQEPLLYMLRDRVQLRVAS